MTEDKTTTDEVDPELMQLPRRRRRRHPLIAAVVIALGLYVLWFLREDLLYYFQPRQPVDLGEVAVELRRRFRAYYRSESIPDNR